MTKSEPVRIALFADLSCPFAFVTHFRLWRLREELACRAVFEHKSLALEYVNREPTPKPLVEAELAVLAREEPDLPYTPWAAPASEWPVTIWPAFEAVKCAERQGLDLADDLAWAIRIALFAEGRCISMRHVLLELAERVGLEVTRFVDDFDGGVAKRRAVDEAQEGWERLRVAGSPTFVLPSGRQISSPALPSLDFDPTTLAITRYERASCDGADCLEVYRALVAEAAREVWRPARDSKPA